MKLVPKQNHQPQSCSCATYIFLLIITISTTTGFLVNPYMNKNVLNAKLRTTNTREINSLIRNFCENKFQGSTYRQSRYTEIKALGFSPLNYKKKKIKFLMTKDNVNLSNELLDRATKLRKEAEEIEEEMKMKRSDKVISETFETKTNVYYESLSDSAWKINFRGRDRSLNDADDQRDLNAVFGDVTLYFNRDGSTDYVHTDKKSRSIDSNESSSEFFSKFWGWEEEIDPIDGLRYLLFSADVKGTKMADAGFVESSRMYFNARIDTVDHRTTASGTVIKVLQLNDGKITVKRDVTTGFWGIFNVSGILAEFRDSGDFVCRPVKLPEASSS